MVIATGAQDLQLTIEPGRGMLGCSLRHRGEELLADGGIPLLHPWANRLDAAARPGATFTAEWQLEVA